MLPTSHWNWFWGRSTLLNLLVRMAWLQPWGEGIIAESWDGDPGLSWQYLYRVCRHLHKTGWIKCHDSYLAVYTAANQRFVSPVYPLKVRKCPVTEKCLKSLTTKPHSSSEWWTTGQSWCLCRMVHGWFHLEKPENILKCPIRKCSIKECHSSKSLILI